MESSLLSFSMPVYPGAHNEHRPHRSLKQRPPLLPPDDGRATSDLIELDRLRRRDRLGRLIHEYQIAA